MKKIKLNISTQQVDSDTLDELAKRFCGTRLSLDDDGIPTQSPIIQNEPFTATVNGCYKDAKDAVEEKFNCTINNIGDTFQRILDSQVREVLASNMEANDVVDGKIKHNSFANLTTIGDWFRGNSQITSFDELVNTNITGLNSYAFNDCTSLESINLTNIKSQIGKTFQGCIKLKVVYLPNVNYKFTAPSNASKDYTVCFCPYGTDIHLSTNAKLVDIGINLGETFDNYYFGQTGAYTIFINRANHLVRPENLASSWWGHSLNKMTIFVKPSFVDACLNDESYIDCSPKLIAAIGGEEWQTTMQQLATDEGKTLDSIHAEFPNHSTVGWDYEYIDYLIYGCEPPTD